MSVFVVDAPAAIELARSEYEAREHELFAPTLLRSQVLAVMRQRVVEGQLGAVDGLAIAERACRLPRRLLGDAVLRANAWKLTAEQGWQDTYDAEYIALTQLHGEGLVAEGDALRRRAETFVAILTVKEFLQL